MQFAPHTDRDLQEMLATVLDSRGAAEHVADGLDALFAHIPELLRLDRPLDLPEGLSEDEVLGTLRRLAGRNDTGQVCFAGGGAYDHYVPAVVGALVSRGELLTAYTPYQPEVSQGVLQALFEYQTAISELTGLPVSNASLYDGGSAAAEAVAMACAATGRREVLLSLGLDAPSRAVVTTYSAPLGRQVQVRAYDPRTGRTPADTVDDGELACVVIQQPNALGVVEDVRAHAEAASAAGAKLIVKWDPTAAGLLATPGSQGADLVVGEGQSLGQGLAYGGPTFGFLACTRDQVRRIPGRIVGRTVDTTGRTGYVMTLRAREQDIRRERATSNICTNQTLNALAGLVYLTWLGPHGLTELARSCLARTTAARRRLTAVEGVDAAVDGPVFKEFAIRVAGDPAAVVAGVHADGYLIGPVLPDGAAAGAILVAVTERRTAAEVEGLAQALQRHVAAARDAEVA